jgi:hypothetical protein
MVAATTNPWYEKLKEFYYREPFRPFVILTSDGRSVRVVKPQYIMFAPTLKTIHVSIGPGEKSAYIDSASVIEVKESTRPASKRRRG